METNESQQQWIRYGKAMMILSGVNCVLLAFYMPLGLEGQVLRIWVGSFGLLNIYFALRSRSPGI